MYGIVATMPVIAIISASVGRAVAPAHEVGRRHVAVLVRHRPQPRRDDERHREDQDRVRDREEAERADREHQPGHGDERVRGVEVTAEQEPGDPAARSCARRAPTRRGARATSPGASATATKPMPGDEREQGDEDDQLDPLDVHVSAPACVVAAVDEDRQHRADRHPGHLVPPEERDPEQLRALRVVDPREQHARRTAPAAASTSRARSRFTAAAPVPGSFESLPPISPPPLRRDSGVHMPDRRRQTHVTSSTIATAVPNATTTQRSVVALSRRASRTPSWPPARLVTAMTAAAAHATGPKNAK